MRTAVPRYSRCPGVGAGAREASAGYSSRSSGREFAVAREADRQAVRFSGLCRLGTETEAPEESVSESRGIR